MMRKFFAFILVFALVMSFGTAHATVTTVTYTIDEVYNGNASYSYYLKGSDGTSNLIHNSGDSAHSEVTIEMGDDVTFKVAAAMIIVITQKKLAVSGIFLILTGELQGVTISRSQARAAMFHMLRLSATVMKMA